MRPSGWPSSTLAGWLVGSVDHDPAPGVHGTHGGVRSSPPAPSLRVPRGGRLQPARTNAIPRAARRVSKLRTSDDQNNSVMPVFTVFTVCVKLVLYQLHCARK